MGFETYKQKIADEKEKIAKMNAKEKWSYFLTYYAVKTGILVFALICIGWIIYDMALSKKNVLYGGALVGCYVTEAGKKELTEDYLDLLGGNPRKDMIDLADDAYMSFTDAEAYNNQSTDSAMYTFLAAGEFNFIIVDEEFVDHYLGMNAFYDLTELTKEMGFSDEDYRLTKEGEKAALLLPEEVCKRNGLSSNSGRMYIAFVPVDQTGKMDAQFLEYLFR